MYISEEELGKITDVIAYIKVNNISLKKFKITENQLNILFIQGDVGNYNNIYNMYSDFILSTIDILSFNQYVKIIRKLLKYKY